jgi:hypothetical protein
MHRKPCLLAFALAWGLLLALGGSVLAAEEPAKVAGSWELTFEGPRGTRAQTLVIQQDGSKIKGTLTGQRGEAPLEGSVDGNKISFTVTRETPNGTFTIEYNGTVEGDSMKGTMHSQMFDGQWSAKRAGGAGEK